MHTIGDIHPCLSTCFFAWCMPTQSINLSRQRPSLAGDQRRAGPVFRPGRIPKIDIAALVASRTNEEARADGAAPLNGNEIFGSSGLTGHTSGTTSSSRLAHSRDTLLQRQLDGMRGPLPQTFECAKTCAVHKFNGSFVAALSSQDRPRAHRPIVEDGPVGAGHRNRAPSETNCSAPEQRDGRARGRGWETAREERRTSPAWISLPAFAQPQTSRRAGEKYLGYRPSVLSEMKTPRKARMAAIKAEQVLRQAAEDLDVAGKFADQWIVLDQHDEALMALSRQRSMPLRLSFEQREHAVLRARQVRDMWRKESDTKSKRSERGRRLKEAREAAEELKVQRQKEEEERRHLAEEERKRLVRKLIQMVFKSLCTDPRTGEAVDPSHIFRKLDKDKSGTIDKDEFRLGLEMCKCNLSDEEVDVLWLQLDGDDGESDGEVDYNVLVENLEARESCLPLAHCVHLTVTLPPWYLSGPPPWDCPQKLN